jgi:penicillin-binding protein 1A
MASVLVALVIVSLALGIYLYRLSASLPDLRVDPRGFKTAQTSVVYAADGSVLAQWHGPEDRTVVPYDEMPRYLTQAVVAIEDQRFYEHHGVDPQSILRALRANTESGGVSQGGSTITQQLIKILFTGGERTLTRKIKEALLAYELESKANKKDVLETYLNTVYFGNGAYGVEAASQHYFGKRAPSLDLGESAMLAGIIRSPNAYDPIDHPRAAKERRNLVLRQMREQGMVTEREAHDAASLEVTVAPPANVPQVGPYFVEYVKQDLIQRLGAKRIYGGGLRVYTTLEPGLQVLAEQSAAQLSAAGDPEVAVVAIRHADGRVLAMVGGRDFRANQFNLAVQGRRQPGSAFKPFVLVSALEHGVRPDQTFDASPYDVKVKDGVWHVQNYENAITSGSMTLRAATNWSVNAVFARLIMLVGPDKVVETARRMGIKSQLEPNPAIALGGLSHGVSPLEMASAYGTLANGGFRTKPTGIIKVTDAKGRVIYQPKPVSEHALDRAVCVEAALMLHDVVEAGTGVEAKIPVWAAGKTGTTQSYRDAWFVGWAGDISTAVWVGHREAQIDMTNVHGIKVTGGSYPARIWKQFMAGATALRSQPVTPPQPGPDGQPPAGPLVLVNICEDSMLLANSRCPRTVSIYLEPSLVPQATCTLH